MAVMVKKSSMKNISVSYDSSRRTKEDVNFSKVAEDLGKKAVRHHFSKGRSVTIFESGKVVRLYKDNRKVVLGE